jgi:hypothetical protein
MEAAARIGQTVGAHIDLDDPDRTLKALVIGGLALFGLAAIADALCEPRKPAYAPPTRQWVVRPMGRA